MLTLKAIVSDYDTMNNKKQKERPAIGLPENVLGKPGTSGANRILTVAVVFLLTFSIACQLDFAEQWTSWTAPHERWEADEVLIALLVAVACLVLIALHRERLYRREVRHHKQTLQRLERALEASLNANHVKSAFLAGVSHELRTPLNAIIGFSEIIRGQLLGRITPTRYHEYAEDIHRSAQHLNRMVCGLLDIAKVESGDYQITPEQIVLADLLGEVIETAEPEATSLGITLKMRVADTLEICADRQAMGQILGNLVFNAMRFHQPVETIVITAECRSAQSIVIGIHDTGSGIEPSDLAHVFDPFVQDTPYQTRMAAEAALSLTVAKRLVDLHGGTIRVISVEGVGTTMEICLPGTDTTLVADFPASPDNAHPPRS